MAVPEAGSAAAPVAGAHAPSAQPPPPASRRYGRIVVWLALGALTALAMRHEGPGWAFDWPPGLILPLEGWIDLATDWLLKEATFGLFTFQDLTRAIAAVISVPYEAVRGLLSGGLAGTAALPAMPPLGWLAVALAAALIGRALGGWGLAALAGGGMLALAAFGQWDSAMVTLASILIAVPLGAAGGLFIGLAAHRWPGFARATGPVLDVMQTMPVFAYLVPVLILFGFSPVSAIIATVIFALPPMVRITQLALARVPAELTDLGRMTGCSPRQMTWKVMVPSARDGLMVGVNQVIMLSLNMVIIASMIGAGGLGFDVLTALRRLDFDAGFTAGLAIVILAVVLDRLSQAAANRPGGRTAAGAAVRPKGRFAARHAAPLSVAAMIVLAALLGLILPPLQAWPAAAVLTTGDSLNRLVEAINIGWFDQIEAVKDAVLLNLLVPVRRFLLELPWPAVAAALALGGWQLGGARLALLAAGLTIGIAATGLWDEAMITVYLCGISALIAMAIGLPLGILAAGRDWLWRPLRLLIDTAQTLPSFVYLMPAVMLFRVGDFTAMIAVVAFAIVPAIRYTVLGLQGVDPQLIEAARAMGCTPWQVLTRVRLRLALPEILLGLNQTIMFALAMLVITALVGTRDLGQEVYSALARAEAGRGLVAGLCIAAIAIIADRLIQASAARARARLGLAP